MQCVSTKTLKFLSVNLSMEEAKGFLYNGAHALAIGILERVARGNPRHFDAYYLMARVYAVQRNKVEYYVNRGRLTYQLIHALYFGR